MTDRMLWRIFDPAHRPGVVELHGRVPLSPVLPAVQAPIRHVLPNGVRVIIQEFRSARWSPSSYGCAPAAATRLSRSSAWPITWSTCLQGTTTRARGFVDRDVEGMGGRMNAGTSLDYTFYQRGAADAARRHDHRDARRYQRQPRSSMRRSSSSRRRSSSRRCGQRGQSPAPPGAAALRARVRAHPYGRPVIGTADIIQSLTRDTLLAFYRRHHARVLSWSSARWTRWRPQNGGADTGLAAARWFPRLPGAVPASLTPEASRNPAARLTGLSRNGVARPEARPCRYPGGRSARLDPRSVPVCACPSRSGSDWGSSTRSGPTTRPSRPAA